MSELEERRAAEQRRLEAFGDAVIIDPSPEATGVLLADQIRSYASSIRLIEPFDERNLKPAGYELTLGDEYFLEGKQVQLGTGESITIPPFNVAILKTAETVNIPAFLIGRWNIRVRWAYEGLLWVGGPQVDPQYIGNLFCPIYNLSNEGVTLQRGEAIALIDFTKTSRIPKVGGVQRPHPYKRPPKRPIIQDFPQLRSALAADVFQRLKAVENKVDAESVEQGKKTADLNSEFRTSLEKVGNRVDSFVGVVFTVFGLLLAVLALLKVDFSPMPRDIVLLLAVGAGFACLLFTMFFATQARLMQGARIRIVGFLVVVGAAVALIMACRDIGQKNSAIMNRLDSMSTRQDSVAAEARRRIGNLEKAVTSPSIAPEARKSPAGTKP